MMFGSLIVLAVSMFMLGYFIGTFHANRKITQLNEKIAWFRSAVVRNALKDADYGRR
jgi:hypothetical protein